ncbi:MAG: 4Fe-4S binding protein [Lachnospiraceae bacterium]|nr:4Fe-4S binding protein [Lachnospiraceae bacterium]
MEVPLPSGQRQDISCKAGFRPVTAVAALAEHSIARKVAAGRPDAEDACVKCGLCAEKCPVGAIDPVSMNPDSKKCISCMRCISICPVGAKKLGRAITSLGGVALGVLCANRKECELFL